MNENGWNYMVDTFWNHSPGNLKDIWYNRLQHMMKWEDIKLLIFHENEIDW